MKSAKFVSDYTPETEANTITIIQRDEGDIDIGFHRGNYTERGVVFAMDGSRNKNHAKINQLFSQIIDLINEG